MSDSINRDQSGRFTPGCKPGPGRPPAAREEEYLKLFRESIDLEEWRKAVLAVLTKAQEGNLKAFEVLAKYVLPLPAQRLQISEEPQEEFRVAGQSAGDTMEDMMRLFWQKLQERRDYEAQLRAQGINMGRPTPAEQSKDPC